MRTPVWPYKGAVRPGGHRRQEPLTHASAELGRKIIERMGRLINDKAAATLKEFEAQGE